MNVGTKHCTVNVLKGDVGSCSESAGCAPKWAQNNQVSGKLEEIAAAVSSGARSPVTLTSASVLVNDLAVMLRNEVTALQESLLPVTELCDTARPFILEGKAEPLCQAASDLLATADNMLDLYFALSGLRNSLRI